MKEGRITWLLDAAASLRQAFPRGGLVELDELPQQVLLAVVEQDGRTIAEISRRLKAHQPGVSVAARELERLGYIQAAVDESNRRRRLFSPTASGLALVDSFLEEEARRHRQHNGGKPVA